MKKILFAGVVAGLMVLLAFGTVPASAGFGSISGDVYYKFSYVNDWNENVKVFEPLVGAKVTVQRLDGDQTSRSELTKAPNGHYDIDASLLFAYEVTVDEIIIDTENGQYIFPSQTKTVILNQRCDFELEGEPYVDPGNEGVSSSEAASTSVTQTRSTAPMQNLMQMAFGRISRLFA